MPENTSELPDFFKKKLSPEENERLERTKKIQKYIVGLDAYESYELAKDILSALWIYKDKFDDITLGELSGEDRTLMLHTIRQIDNVKKALKQKRIKDGAPWLEELEDIVRKCSLFVADAKGRFNIDRLQHEEDKQLDKDIKDFFGDEK